MEVPGKAQLVFVHGIGGVRDSADESRTWLTALADGARDAGHADAVSGLTQGWLAETRFVNYSDLFAPIGTQGAGETGECGDVEQIAFLGALVRELTDELLSQAQEQGDAHALRVIADALPQFPNDTGELQGTGEPLRVLARILTTLLQLPGLRRASQWASGWPLLGQLAQVGQYLDRRAHGRRDGNLDALIRQRVLDSVDPERPLVVVAHSLGSVVAYEALHHLAQPTRLFITLGAPLATAAVVLNRVIPRPARTPHSVERWLNFWDRDDIVVCRPRIKDWMLPNSAGVVPVTRRVDSDGIWVHTSTKYLRQPAVAGPIAEALKQS
ncbi:alpha/beta fold hydrolase [Streptomyces sp. NPDC059010]|uniref:alpha/beta fold hydrolase n=1 Tax=Streptomyces sp. NPDC059010 TaxID=3346695 RepID=UPI00369A6DD6